mgnify:CR=1 FL=1
MPKFRSRPEPLLFETEVPFSLTAPPSDKRSYDKVARLCPRCGRELTDKAYFGSNCFRGTCVKREKEDR